MRKAVSKKPAPAADAQQAELVAALNAATVAQLDAIPLTLLEPRLRKWLRLDDLETKTHRDRVMALAFAYAATLHLFEPSLSGVRPIDRAARASAARGGVEARALAALAASHFRIFEVDAWGERDLATARDCATGESFSLIVDDLDPALAGFEAATRLCPLGGGVFWPMGPLVPAGRRGEGRAARFPKRPGKGLINANHVAALLFGEYVRAGAPQGVDFGLSGTMHLTHADEELDDWASRQRESGVEPKGERLAQLRAIASAARLGAALCCTVELAAAGVEDGAAIYRAAAEEIARVLLARMRVGSTFGALSQSLRRSVDEAFAPDRMPEKAARLFEEVLRKVRPAEDRAESRDESLARVIERIRALRQKTVELGCTEQEAMRAAEKVAELLERYGLSLSEIEMRNQTCEGFGFDAGRKQTAPIDDVFRTTASFCDCRTWMETTPDGGLRHVFFGLPADIEAVRCLKDLAEAAFAAETAAFKRGDFYRGEAAPGRRALLKSFEIGLARGICTKLDALKTEREKSASRSSGRDLAIAKRSILDEEMEKLGLSLRAKAQRRKKVVAQAFRQGVAASHRFNVNEKIG